MALATRYEVRTQVASSGVTERLPAICCSDTFTTVVSSTSIKVPSITEMAMIHGLTTGFESVIYLCRCQTSLAIGSKLSDISLLPTAQRDWPRGQLLIADC